MNEMRLYSTRKELVFVMAVWITLVGSSYLWNYAAAKAVRNEIALQTARSFFDQIVITREWNAQHGWVYVPVTESTQPNSYLDAAGRDIVVNQGMTLTKVNPAYMTRQISEIAAKQNGVKFHITSLLPIRPENTPTPREREALDAFERGEKEVGQFTTAQDGAVYFYMAPLKTESACLPCHAQQGYKEGDIRGGISVTLPVTQKIPLITLATGHLGIGLAGVIGIFLFGARLEKYTGMLQRQSVIDALTGIPNRRSFSETILHEFRRARRENVSLSVIMCDVDRFKAYNDRYGHAAGDECLKKVAKAIKETLNRPADFCARYGGEEFVIILPSTSINAAQHIAGKIRETIQGLGIVHEASLPLKIVTMSLGVASMDAATSDEELIRQADSALYMAKEGGRNRVEKFTEV